VSYLDKKSVEHFIKILDEMIEELEIKREKAECKHHKDILYTKIVVIAEAKERIIQEWL
jgi:hypothetical protein